MWINEAWKPTICCSNNTDTVFLPFRFVLGEMPIMKNNFEGNQSTWRKTLTAMKHKKEGF
jgi:hypothetical protein